MTLARRHSDQEQAGDPLSVLIRAAVRAELEPLRAEIRRLSVVERPPKPKERLTLPEAAQELGVSPRTVRRWVKLGQLSVVQLGTGKRPRVFVTRASIEAMLKRAGG